MIRMRCFSRRNYRIDVIMKHSLAPFSILLLLLTWLTVTPASANRLYYTGTVGKAAVQMDLTFTGKQVSGSYWYEENPQLYDKIGLMRNEIDVKGTLTAKGQVALVEKDMDGITSGAITGTFANASMRFTGAWSKPDRTQKLPVALQAVARYISFSQIDNQRRIECTATYPHLLAPTLKSGDLDAYLKANCSVKMNAFIACCLEGGSYKDATQGCTQEYTISIAYYSQRFISLLVADDQNTWGVHPNTDFDTYNLILTSGSFNPICFDDLFQNKAKDKLIPLLTRKVQSIKRVRAPELVQENVIVSEDLHEQNILTKVLLLPKGAVFVFPRYAVGCYAECEYFVTVPYAELTDIINHNAEIPSFVLGGSRK